MKNEQKIFLISCNLDRDNQLCYLYEREIADKLLKKGFVSKIENCTNGEFFIWLSKKGLKKVIKLNKN